MFHLSGITKLLQHILDRDWDAAIFRACNYHREVRRWEVVKFDDHKESSVLPIHQACALGAPFTLIKTLLSIYPESVFQKDSFFHRRPLHIAALKGSSTEVIQLLASACREAAGVQDALGRVPLHYCVFSHAPIEAVRALLKAGPDSARVQDFNGWLPLHVAIRYGSTDEVICALVHAYAGGLNVQTVSGMTPAMVADKFGVCTEPSKQVLLGRRRPPAKHLRTKSSSLSTTEDEPTPEFVNSNHAVAA